ncbi:unnamed protein product [Linum tenue]|uniref:Secreted protein n=1 Tax=Linum tenue TaxID=586396 RepID=A0AAV0JW89_9ROSI|nr:unnamed protein product [Linum tenue]
MLEMRIKCLWILCFAESFTHREPADDNHSSSSVRPDTGEPITSPAATILARISLSLLSTLPDRIHPASRKFWTQICEGVFP